MSDINSLSFNSCPLNKKSKNDKEKVTHLLGSTDKSSISEACLNIKRDIGEKEEFSNESKKTNSSKIKSTEKENFEHFLERMKENTQITQAVGKTYDVFLFRFDSKVLFNILYFFKFLFYHILYHLTLGPLVGLALIPIEGINMVRNMQFLNLNWTQLSMILQYICAGPNIAIIFYLKYFYFENGKIVDQLPNFFTSEMIFTVFALFLRILIISFRYGYTSKAQMANRYLPEIPNLQQEYIIPGWRYVKVETIDEEVTMSLVRKEIEIDMFLVNFITWMTRDWVERLSTDDYHRTHDQKFLHNMNLKNYQTAQQEKQFLIKMKKVKFDQKLYSKLKPIFEKIKKEKIEENLTKKNARLTLQSTKSSSIKNLVKVEKTYKTTIKKIAGNFKNISSKKQIQPHLIGYSLMNVNEKSKKNQFIPFYLVPVQIELLNYEFPCRIISREIFCLSKKAGERIFTNTIKFLTIAHTFIPCIYRMYIHHPPFGGNFMEIFIIILNIVALSFIFFYNMMYIEVGGNDYARREYCMKALSSLISPDKILLPLSLRIFPTINIFSPKSMKSWMNLRIVLMDIGLRYTKRVELYTSCFLFTYLLLVIALLLGNFHILTSFNFHYSPVTFLMGYTEAFIFAMVFYRMIHLGVSLNNYFQIHKYELIFMKSSFKHILLNWQVFIEMSSYVDPYLHKTKEFYYLCQEYHDKYTPEQIENDRMYGTFIPKDDEEFKSHLNVLIENLDNIIERIELEENIAPVKLLGIKLTSDLLNQFYITIITLLISLGQYIISTYLM